MRHADGQRGRSAGAAKEGFLAKFIRQRIHLTGGDGKAMGANHGRGRGGLAFDVHAEIHARVERAGGDERHDGHKRFATHRAIANGSRIPFAGDELGSRAAGDERMKTGNGTAGDGDETKREHFAGDDQAGTVGELGERGQLQHGQHKQNAERQRNNCAQLHERAQIIAGREQQPHRQTAGNDAVADDEPGDGDVMQTEDLRPVRILINQFATPNRQ